MNMALLISLLFPLSCLGYTVKNFTFANYIDHFADPLHKTFTQRYYVVDDYWNKSEGSPVILHLCGESTCNFPLSRQFPLRAAEQLKARYVVLEHRYYGESQPVPDWTNENLRFLTEDQALADTAFFVESMKARIKNELKIGTKWIVVGGSYAGGLAAWFRYKYPHLVIGALASSGVVTPLNDYWMFEKQVVDALQISGEACLNVLRYYEEYAESKLFGASESERAAFLRLFGGTGRESIHEFMYYFADLHSMFPQYSHRERLCNLLLALNKSGKPIEQQLTEYAEAGRTVEGTLLPKYTYAIRGNTTINATIASRQWAYQFCTTYGWLQTPSRVSPLRWKGMDVAFWLEYCRHVFGRPLVPATDHCAAMYGGDTVARLGSRIFFTQGKDDPWRWVGINQLVNAGPDNELAVMNCDDCGHCRELYTPQESDPKEVKEARTGIVAAFRKWIQN